MAGYGRCIILCCIWLAMLACCDSARPISSLQHDLDQAIRRSDLVCVNGDNSSPSPPYCLELLDVLSSLRAEVGRLVQEHDLLCDRVALNSPDNQQCVQVLRLFQTLQQWEKRVRDFNVACTRHGHGSFEGHGSFDQKQCANLLGLVSMIRREIEGKTHKYDLVCSKEEYGSPDMPQCSELLDLFARADDHESIVFDEEELRSDVNGNWPGVMPHQYAPRQKIVHMAKVYSWSPSFSLYAIRHRHSVLAKIHSIR